jgi:hypothetical protein
LGGRPRPTCCPPGTCLVPAGACTPPGCTHTHAPIQPPTHAGRCNGIGYVNFTDPGAARGAQELMNGVDMGERLLHVMVQHSPGGGARQGGGGGAAMPPTW